MNEPGYRSSPYPETGALGNGSYAVAVDTDGSAITLTSTGTVMRTSRRIRQVLTLVSYPLAFTDYAAFGGDAFTEVKTDGTITGDIFQYGDIKYGSGIVNGDVYATGSADPGPSSPLPVPLPESPTLDTTYYDGQIAIAADSGGNKPPGDVNLADFGGVLYIDGSATFEGVTITGPGTIVTSDSLELKGDTVAGDDITFIAGGDLRMATGASVGSRCVLFAPGTVKIETGGNVTGVGSAILTPGKVEIKTKAVVQGIVYAGTGSNKIETESKVYGSVYSGGKMTIQTKSEVVHDPTRFPPTPPVGLGPGTGTPTLASATWEEI
jgi:hypothetical protein